MAALAAKTLVVLASAPAVAGLMMTRGSANNSSDGPNVCMRGHFAPEFFLLGVPKGGTTYFYEDFVRSDAVVNYLPRNGEEEWHVKEAWVFAPDERDISEKDYWLSHYPECQQAKRLVAIDGTPGYFGCATSSKTIYKFYEGSGHIYDLKFMVFLRNPVTRAHSHYYQYVENDVFNGAYGEACSAEVYPKTFDQAVQNLLTNHEMCEGCACNDVFQDSMYAASFKNYFEYFPTRQFFVVPFEVAVLPELVTYVWDLFGMPHGTGEKESLASDESGGETNHHEYPTLAEDLDGPTREAFEKYIEDRTGASEVAKVLEGSEAHLYSYTDSMSNPDGIKHWLIDNWGA